MSGLPRPDETTGVSVHAGFPNPAADAVKDADGMAARAKPKRRVSELDLNRLLIKHPVSTFMFRIRGERGIMQGIFDGDIAIVDRMATPQTNDLVLWHDGQHFNLSRPSKVPDGGSRWGTVTAVVRQYQSKHQEQ